MASQSDFVEFPLCKGFPSNRTVLESTIEWLQLQDITCPEDLVGARRVSMWDGNEHLPLLVLKFLDSLIQVMGYLFIGVRRICALLASRM